MLIRWNARTIWSTLRRSFAIAAVASIAIVATSLPAHAAISDKRNDYNGDGISDIVAIADSSGCLVRWAGNGSGGFAAGVQVGCGWDAYLGSLAAPGDIDSDGDGDVVAINSTSGCLVRWLGNGNGGFGAGVQLGCGWAPYQNSITGAGDLNNDGDSDIVAINSTSGCLVRWLGNGNGGFGAGVQLGCGWAPYAGTGSLSGMGALNGDGNGDIVAINLSSGCLFRWFGNGNGGFGTGVEVGCGWLPYFLAA